MNDPNKPNQLPDAEQRSIAYAKRKKTVRILAIVFAVIAVISIASVAFDPDALIDRWFGDDEEKASQQIEFYPVDERENIFQNDYYQGLDRRVFYNDPATGATYSLEGSELSVVEPFARFFYYYFDTVIKGDVDGYPVYFSNGYIEKNELPDEFTMQMIYDILVRPYSLASDETRQAYLVDYKIYRNNGTFRDDIGSNASRTLVFYLIEENGDLVIDEIKPFTEY